MTKGFSNYSSSDSEEERILLLQNIADQEPEKALEEENKSTEFKDLPSDTKELVLPFLGDQSIAALSQANRDLNDLTKEEIEKRKIELQINASIDPANPTKLIFTDQLVSTLNEAEDNQEKQALITKAIIKFNETNPNVTCNSLNLI